VAGWVVADPVVVAWYELAAVVERVRLSAVEEGVEFPGCVEWLGV
jgi:hypothetical protein